MLITFIERRYERDFAVELCSCPLVRRYQKSCFQFDGKHLLRPAPAVFLERSAKRQHSPKWVKVIAPERPARVGAKTLALYCVIATVLKLGLLYTTHDEILSPEPCFLDG